jgi:hypothetical protein
MAKSITAEVKRWGQNANNAEKCACFKSTTKF